MKKQISVQNFSDEVAIISTPPGVAKSESSESGEPSDSMFPSIPRAAPLCIFQGEAPHHPHAQPKYSCASRLCDTIRCHFSRVKIFLFLLYLSCSCCLIKPSQVSQLSQVSQVIPCLHAQPHCALCIVNYAFLEIAYNP